MEQHDSISFKISSEIQFHVTVRYKLDCDNYAGFEVTSSATRLQNSEQKWWYTLCLSNDDIILYFDMDNYSKENYKDLFKEKVNDFLKKIAVKD